MADLLTFSPEARRWIVDTAVRRLMREPQMSFGEILDDAIDEAVLLFGDSTDRTPQGIIDA